MLFLEAAVYLEFMNEGMEHDMHVLPQEWCRKTAIKVAVCAEILPEIFFKLWETIIRNLLQPKFKDSKNFTVKIFGSRIKRLPTQRFW